jgi:hypothetical protein
MALKPSSLSFPPKYVNKDKYPPAERIAITFIVIEIVVVALHFVSRRMIKAKLAFDDYLIIPSLDFCLGMNALNISITPLCATSPKLQLIASAVEVRLADIGKHFPVIIMTDPGLAKGGLSYRHILQRGGSISKTLEPSVVHT